MHRGRRGEYKPRVHGNGETGGSQDTARRKSLESAVTTGDNPRRLWQSSARLREMEEWGGGEGEGGTKRRRDTVNIHQTVPVIHRTLQHTHTHTHLGPTGDTPTGCTNSLK